MSRRGIRLVFAIVVPAIVVAAVAVGRMTAASAQAGMRRAPTRRIVRPTVPTRQLVVVKAGEGGAAVTTGGPGGESGDPPPQLLSRSTLRSVLGGAVGDVWLDLTPRQPGVPNKGHLQWHMALDYVTAAQNAPDGYVKIVRISSPTGHYPGFMKIHVRPQVAGARYAVDCSVQADGPLTVSYRDAEYVIPAVDGHLLFIWDTGGGGTEWDNYVSIRSPDSSWTFYRCQLTFLGGPET